MKCRKNLALSTPTATLPTNPSTPSTRSARFSNGALPNGTTPLLVDGGAGVPACVCRRLVYARTVSANHHARGIRSARVAGLRSVRRTYELSQVLHQLRHRLLGPG